MKKLSNKEAALLIERAVKFLKKQYRTRQAEIGIKIGVSSGYLSKAKNFEGYKHIKREERNKILEKIISEYALLYNKEKEDFEKNDDTKERIDNFKVNNQNDNIYYVVYYYSAIDKKVNKGYASINEGTKSIIFKFQKKDNFNSIWEGKYDSPRGSTIFIRLTRINKDLLPLKAFFIMYCGGYQRLTAPILLGVYSSTKTDNKPVAGEILFEKVENEKIAIEKMEQEAHDKVIYYLRNSNITSQNELPISVNNLPRPHSIERVAGDYLLYYNSCDFGLTKTNLKIMPNGKVFLQTRDNSYYGFVRDIENKTIEIELILIKNTIEEKNKENRIFIFLDLPGVDFKCFSGVLIGRHMNRLPIGYLILISSESVEDEILEKYFKSSPSSHITAIPRNEMEKLF